MPKKTFIQTVKEEFNLIGRQVKDFLSKPSSWIFMFGLTTVISTWGFFLYYSTKFDFLNKINQSSYYCKDLNNKEIFMLMSITFVFMLSAMFCLGEFVNYNKPNIHITERKIAFKNSLITFVSSLSSCLLGLYLVMSWC